MKAAKTSEVRTKRTFFSSQLIKAGAIIAILGIFCASMLMVFASVGYKNSLEVAYEQHTDDAQKIDRYLQQLQYTLAEISTDKVMYDVPGFIPEEGITVNQISENLRLKVYGRKQNEFAECVSAAFIVPKSGSEYIFNSTGLVRRDVFFETQYKNKTYTNEFWLGELRKDPIFTVYDSAKFESTLDTGISNTPLTPVSYKMPGNDNFIIVCLMDFSKIRDISASIAIVGANDNPVAVIGEGFNFDSNIVKEGEEYTKVNGGHIIGIDSVITGISYNSYISNEEISDNWWNVLITVFFTLLVLICLISFFICYIVAKKERKVITQISNALRFDQDNTEEAAGLQDISEQVHELIEVNNAYVREITQKDELLKTVFIQSRVRDVYVSIDDMEEKLNLSDKFALVYFRVNFVKGYLENINEERGKIVFYLKQLIELYMSNAGLEATVFQVENDQIVAVVTAEKNHANIVEKIDGIVEKLNNESQYVFFTIVISDVYENSSKLKNVYDNVYALSRYARPMVTQTQVLKEGGIRPGAGRFYFSVEQMEKLTALLQNEKPENSIHLLDEILDYNIKKDINGFDLYLLCTEIVNCAVKLVNRIFHTTPAALHIPSAYTQLDKAVTFEQYREVCKTLIVKTVEYISVNKRQEDYIISYILDYVENHYAEDIYLNLFAEKLKLTTAYISSYFKSKMNINLIDYVNSYRIKKAVAMVEDSQNPLLKNKEIAEQVGIPNINTFIRLFKKYTGHTPSEYRKLHTN